MATPLLFPWLQPARLPSSPLVLLVVVAHLALAWLVLYHRSDVRVSEPRNSLQVSLITQESAQASEHKPEARPAAALPSAAPLLSTRQNMHGVSTSVAQAVAQASTLSAGVALKKDSPVQVASEPAASASVTLPRFDAAYLDNPVPSYPVLSRRLREEGQVMLRVFVSAKGAPDKIELRQSSGYPRLDAAAQEVVRQWHFIPARQGEASVSAWVLVPILFSLRS